MATVTLSSSCDNLLALHHDVSVTANVTTRMRSSSSSPDQPLVAAQPSDLDPTDDATMAEDCAESLPPATGFNKTIPCSPTSAMVSTQRNIALSSSLHHLLRSHLFHLSLFSLHAHSSHSIFFASVSVQVPDLLPCRFTAQPDASQVVPSSAVGLTTPTRQTSSAPPSPSSSRLENTLTSDAFASDAVTTDAATTGVGSPATLLPTLACTPAGEQYRVSSASGNDCPAAPRKLHKRRGGASRGEGEEIPYPVRRQLRRLFAPMDFNTLAQPGASTSVC